MTQHARPTSTIFRNGWVDQAGGVNLHLAIDEASADQADYITRAISTNGQYCEVGLGAVTDPGIHTGHVIRFGGWHDGGFADPVFDVALYDGSTLIARCNPTVTTSPALYSRTLAELEAAVISNYSNLRFRIDPLGTGGTGGFNAFVYWAVLEVPDAGFLHLDASGAALQEVAIASGHHLTPSGAGLLRSAGTETVGSLILPTGSGLGVKT